MSIPAQTRRLEVSSSNQTELKTEAALPARDVIKLGVIHAAVDLLPFFSLDVIRIIVSYFDILELREREHSNTEIGQIAKSLVTASQRRSYIAQVLFTNHDYLQVYPQLIADPSAISKRGLDIDRVVTTLQKTESQLDQQTVFKALFEDSSDITLEVLNVLLKPDAEPEQEQAQEFRKIKIEAFCLADPEGAQNFLDKLLRRSDVNEFAKGPGPNYETMVATFVSCGVDITRHEKLLWYSFCDRQILLFKMLLLRIETHGSWPGETGFDAARVLASTSAGAGPFVAVVLASKALPLPLQFFDSILDWAQSAFCSNSGYSFFHNPKATSKPDLLTIIKALISSDFCDELMKANKSESPFHKVARLGELTLLDLFLSHCPRLINLLDVEGRTPLMSALASEKTQAVELLIKHGTDHTIIDKKGNSALLLAVKKRNLTAVELLLKQGADARTADSDKNSVLNLAIEGPFVAAVRLLLEHGADPFIANTDGNTAFHLALLIKHRASQSDVKKIQKLLFENPTFKVPVYLANRAGEHLVDLAFEHGYHELSESLLTRAHEYSEPERASQEDGLLHASFFTHRPKKLGREIPPVVNRFVIIKQLIELGVPIKEFMIARIREVENPNSSDLFIRPFLNFLDYIVKNNNLELLARLKDSLPEQDKAKFLTLVLKSALKTHNYEILQQLLQNELKYLQQDKAFSLGIIREKLLADQKVLTELSQFLSGRLTESRRDHSKKGCFDTLLKDPECCICGLFCICTCLIWVPCCFDMFRSSLHVIVDKRVNWVQADRLLQIHEFLTPEQLKKSELVKDVLPVLSQRQRLLTQVLGQVANGLGDFILDIAESKVHYQAPPRLIM